MKIEAKHEDVKINNKNMAEVCDYEFVTTLIR